MKYGAALVVMAIGEQGRAVTSKDKVTWQGEWDGLRIRSLWVSTWVFPKMGGFPPKSSIRK